MTIAGWLEIALTLALVVAVAWPLGAFMAAVFDGRKTLLTPLAAPVELKWTPFVGPRTAGIKV
jgi:K+-transporting ATPase ATPase A chain